MTEEEVIIEYEATLCYEEEQLKTCPFCGKRTYRKQCPYCDGKGAEVQLTGDTEVDDLFARIEAGEDVDLEQLRGSSIKDEFETVTPGSMP